MVRYDVRKLPHEDPHLMKINVDISYLAHTTRFLE